MKPFAILTIAVALTSAVTLPGQVRPQLLGIGPSSAALFNDSALHEIRLVVNSQDWESLKERYLDNTYYPADFQWHNQVVRGVGIRSRGGISRSPVKPGLRVDFDRYTADQTFLGLKSVVLRNNTRDASNMNERLSMLLFSRLGLPASREAFTTLFVNNEYVGLYTIVESIDKSFLRRSYGEDEGYLYEYVWEKPYYFEYRGSDPDSYVPLPFEPETHEDDPRPEFIEQLVWTINETSDAVFRTAIAEYLDLAKFIRHVAVETFIEENDDFLGYAGMANFYFYRFNNTRLFTFIPWDKSEALKDGFRRSIFHNITDVPDSQQNRLMRRALSYPDLYNLYLDTLLECVRSTGPQVLGGPGWLGGEIEREYQQIRDAARADPVKPFSNEEFENAVDFLRLFARSRGDFVTDEVTRFRPQRVLRAPYRQSPLPKSRND